MIKLFEHQIVGKNRLLKNNRYCLFWEMGTGKTYTALAALQELPPSRILISAPKQVLNRVWLNDDTLKLFDLSKHQVDYINYEKVPRNKNFIHEKYDVMVLDEVHKLKGLKTKTSKKYKVVAEKAKYVWGLTGTPVANSYADTYCIYKNMGIDVFNNMSYNEFIERYYHIKRIAVAPGSYMTYPMFIGVKRQNEAEVITKISEASMFKRMVDCQDLPAKRTDVVMVKGMMTPEYLDIMNEGVIDMEEEGYTDTFLRLTALQKAHQASNGYIYNKIGEPIPITKNKKLDTLKDLLSDMLAETEKVIIVYNFKEDLKQLISLAENEKYTYTLDSKEFEENNNQILFIQFSRGEGLNLQFCNHMIFYTYSWSYVSYDQMAARIYRTGQTKKVMYYILMSAGTIESKIWNAIRTKQSVNDFIKEVLYE